MIRISVIIPFHNEIDALKLCLRCLGEQTYPQADFEIIAVNNAAIRVPPDVVAANPRGLWLAEPLPGSYRARNRGMRHAQGEIIVFTDADCRPAATWLAEGVQ